MAAHRSGGSSGNVVEQCGRFRFVAIARINRKKRKVLSNNFILKRPLSVGAALIMTISRQVIIYISLPKQNGAL